MILLAGACLAGEAETVFSRPPTAVGSTLEFTVARRSDVEVAVLDAKDVVVRHLAAGVLGGESAPPAPLAPGLAQRLAWDGQDDHGQAAVGGPFRFRVRTGMGVRLQAIAGGDPYAFYSRDMGQGDHYAFRVTGLDVKANGDVYVMGNASNLGPPTIRQYAADGTYRRTVFPFPAGKPLDAVKGWGVNVRTDGTYAPGYSDLAAPAMSRIPIGATRAGCAALLPSPSTSTVTVSLLAGWDKPTNIHALVDIGSDGSLPAYAPRPLFADLPPPKALAGPLACAYGPDGAGFVTGLYVWGDAKGQSVETSGPWRDGQVWRIDPATGKSAVFFALPETELIGDMKARAASPIGHLSRYANYAALHCLAVDRDGSVLVGDRQNRRIIALDPAGKVRRELRVEHADAIAIDPGSHALYVTTRTGDVFTKGSVRLLRFADWTKDDAPAQTIEVCPSYGYSPRTFLGACRSGGATMLWLAYTTLPVRVYRDGPEGLQLAKDFSEAGPQRCLDMQHMVADPATDQVYVSDGSGACFRIADWRQPALVRCLQAADQPLNALNLAIDARRRVLYGHADRKPVVRYRMDGAYFEPLPVPGAADAAVTTAYNNDWRIGLGFGDRGFAVAPDGSVATLGGLRTEAFKMDDYGGYLHVFRADERQAPWPAVQFKQFGNPRAGGIRFDAKGNLYVGVSAEGKPAAPPAGFDKDKLFLASLGTIRRYAPTGKPGDLFPSEPAAPDKVYAVNYGSISNMFARTARFGVDGWGRIYYPTSLEPRVSVIDNEGNALLAFGTYGNRDSLGGLPGDAVPTADVPMAWPNSVDATDDYVYVSDLVNIRVLRLAKTFAASALAPIR